MELQPISLILQALAAGAASAAKDAASDALKSAYTRLKAQIKRALTKQPDAESAQRAEIILAAYEKAPDVWEKPLRAELEKAGVDKDKEVLEAAQTTMNIQASVISLQNINVVINVENQSKSVQKQQNIYGYVKHQHPGEK